MKNWADRLKNRIHDNPEAAGGELISPDKETKVAKPKKVKRNFFARIRRESKRDRQLAALTDGYQQLIGLMGSIQLHLESQSQSQQRLLNAMEHLPDVADGLKKMGVAAEKQTEVMGLMSEHDRQLADSMTRFNKTLVTMNRMAAVKGFVLMLLILAAVAVGVYFSLGDSAKDSVNGAVTGLFDRSSEPAAETVEPAAEPVVVEPEEEVIVLEEEPVDPVEEAPAVDEPIVPPEEEPVAEPEDSMLLEPVFEM